ncbi:MAG TPA: hypothetical protein ENI88_13775 [Desulfobulbus sp.]|nr:hypothetical protein [Desulfobulbus sp.]
MMVDVLQFSQYPFRVGQKIHIADGPRKGDWEVISVDAGKVGLRCPVTGFEARWPRFCYFVEESSREWPEGAAEE